MFIQSEIVKNVAQFGLFFFFEKVGGVEEGLDHGFETPNEVDRPIQIRSHNGTFIFFRIIELGEKIHSNPVCKLLKPSWGSGPLGNIRKAIDSISRKIDMPRCKIWLIASQEPKT